MKCLWLVQGSHDRTEFCDVLPRPVFKRWMQYGDDAQKKEKKPKNEPQTLHEEETITDLPTQGEQGHCDDI